MSYPNPIAACQALRDILNPGPDVEVHIGELNTGRTRPCCDSDVLAIETGRTYPLKGVPMQVLGGGTNCNELAQEIIVSYRTCFQTNQGKSALSIAKLTEMGSNVVIAWWQVLVQLASSDDGTRQNFRFVSRDPDEPSGGCIGWRLTFETTVCVGRLATGG